MPDAEETPDADEDASGDRTSPTPTRRQTLLAAGGIAAAAAGCAGSSTDATRSPPTDAEVSHPGPRRRDAAGRDDFLWLGAALWRAPDLRENLLAFAARHDLAACFVQPDPADGDPVEALRPALEAASDAGVEAWVNAGLFQRTTPEAVVGGGRARQRHLDDLRALARTLADLFDRGRVVCWQEAPVMGRWATDGKWTDATVDNLLQHGPAVFEAQRSALLDANPSLDVGVFVHFPYIVDSKQPGVFETLAARLRDRGATPDFGFTDFYRGWYEKDVGPGPADDAVRSLVSNARTHLDGADVFYLGQVHTINPGHTPSADSIHSTLRAATDAGAAGVGWYLRTNYQPTTTGFDPLVPNAEDASFADEPVVTATVARDRPQYAWNATLASRAVVDPADRFDCWLHGEGLGFWSTRVEARTADGEWTFLGDVGGYLDGDYPYADTQTTVFRALPRDRFVVDGALELRVELDSERADRDGSGAALETAVAMPWDPDHFVAEPEATTLLDGDADVSAFQLGRASPAADLGLDAVRVSVPVADRAPSLTSLVHPEHADAVRRLAAAEAREGFDPDARFDCWLTGRGLADPAAAPRIRDPNGTAVDLREVSVAWASSPSAGVFYGLDRERFLRGDLDLGVGAARIDAAYAMPAAGSAAFRPPDRVADLLASQPGEVATYALDRIRRE